MINRDDFLLEKIYLKPGELVIAEEPVMVKSVLGSCIAVTMFHPATRVAAICHGMLPNGGKSDSFKYVDSSICYMMRYFDFLKISRNEIEAKLFGGSDMFTSAQPSVRNLTVGWQNISVATRCLKENGLALAASDVGGKRGRKLIFKSDTGDVYIKKMIGQERIPIL